MTEAEWLACEDTRLMLQALRGKVNDRRFFRFAALCWRRGSRFLEGEADHRGVEALESLADGEAIDNQDLRKTEEGGFLICLKDIGFGIEVSTDSEYAVNIAVHSAEAVAMAEARETGDRLSLVAAIVPRDIGETNEWQEARVGLEAALLQYRPLVLEFFGNPFRPALFDSEWRTSNVVSLARSIHETSDFSAMPILSDALQDAGCENEDILNHCRSEGPHVRDCWVVDLILGKD